MNYYHIRTYTPFCGEEADVYISAKAESEYILKATNAANENGKLLREMKEINDLSLRVNEHNDALIAECRKLRKQLAVVTAERDRYLDLLPNVSEIEPATKEETPAEDPEAQWERYYLNV